MRPAVQGGTHRRQHVGGRAAALPRQAAASRPLREAPAASRSLQRLPPHHTRTRQPCPALCQHTHQHTPAHCTPLTCPAGGDEADLLAGRRVAAHRGGVTDVLVVTAAVGMLHRVHGHTTHLQEGGAGRQGGAEAPHVGGGERQRSGRQGGGARRGAAARSSAGRAGEGEGPSQPPAANPQPPARRRPSRASSRPPCRQPRHATPWPAPAPAQAPAPAPAPSSQHNAQGRTLGQLLRFTRNLW